MRCSVMPRGGTSPCTRKLALLGSPPGANVLDPLPRKPASLNRPSGLVSVMYGGSALCAPFLSATIAPIAG